MHVKEMRVKLLFKVPYPKTFIAPFDIHTAYY